ncbi:MAG: hypothetical protein V3V20_11105 [Algisphaera sp.]
MNLQAQSLEIYATQDAFAALEPWTDLPDVLAAITGMHETMRHCYWVTQNLSATVFFAQAAIQHGLTAASQAQDPDQADALRGAAKAACYDLASFTWPGWGEDAISPTRDDLERGLQAAHTNLRLTRALGRDNLAHSRSHWVLGAQRLANGHLKTALQSFERAAQHATEGDHQADHLLNTGYAALVNQMALPDTKPAAFETALDQLRNGDVKGGPRFANQLDTAAGVFLGSKQ